MTEFLLNISPLLVLLALLTGWLLDLLLGDPAWLPHPVVWFGKAISSGEHQLNKGRNRRVKGGMMATVLILLTFAVCLLLLRVTAQWPAVYVAVSAVMVFFCLAGTTLIREVRAVFLALDRSLDEGRRQVGRIVGRDTSELSEQEVRTAALETLAENLSDGVIAPLFWLLLLGPAGMMAYKMVNTLDSMIGYRTERYREFGCWAAHIDDAANYIPARLTALLMVATPLPLSNGEDGHKRFALNALWRNRAGLLRFVRHYGRCHASPNSGYPEAALAGILNCRFGGPHYYFGQLFPKPYIGHNERPLTTADMRIATRVNRWAEVAMILITAITFLTLYLWRINT